VRVSLLEIESGQRGFLLTANTAYLDNYRYNRAILRLRLEVLCRQIPNTEANKHLCGELAALIDKKLQEMEDTVRLARAGKVREALTIVRTDRGLQYTRAIDDRLHHIRIEPGAPMESCLAE
jgi:CHASE3 domain sensor protein